MIQRTIAMPPHGALAKDLLLAHRTNWHGRARTNEHLKDCTSPAPVRASQMLAHRVDISTDDTSL
jgi:hypothetical protein